MADIRQPDPRATLWFPREAGPVRYAACHLRPGRQEWRFIVLLLVFFLPVALVTAFLGKPVYGLWLETGWAAAIVAPILLVFTATQVLVCERALEKFDMWWAGLQVGTSSVVE